jgi:hypothetical protein
MQFEQMILKMNEDPEFVHKVFRYVVEEVQAPFINMLFKAFPDAGTNGSDAIGSLPFISEEILDEYSIPNILKLRELTGQNPKLQVDNWWGDSFSEDTEKFWGKKLEVTPRYLKVQDPDLYQVGAVKAREWATETGTPIVLELTTMSCKRVRRKKLSGAFMNTLKLEPRAHKVINLPCIYVI